MSEQNYEMSGTVKKIGDVQSFPSGFSKREIVITVGGKYPQDIMFEAIKDRGDLLDKFVDGDDVTISFNIAGRESNGRYYNTLKLWKIKLEHGAATTTTSAPTGAPPAQPTVESEKIEDDSLPF